MRSQSIAAGACVFAALLVATVCLLLLICNPPAVNAQSYGSATCGQSIDNPISNQSGYYYVDHQ